MALILSVVYDDGTSEDIRIRPAGIVAAERKFGGDLPGIEGTIYAAWFTKGMPGDFDSWLNSLAEASDRQEAQAPLVETPSPKGSRTSP